MLVVGWETWGTLRCTALGIPFELRLKLSKFIFQDGGHNELDRENEQGC